MQLDLLLHKEKKMRNSIVRNIHIALKMLRKISTTEKKLMQIYVYLD